jgi:predicted MFS family arabinose efflux permease
MTGLRSLLSPEPPREEVREFLLPDGSRVPVRWVRDARARRLRLIVAERGVRLTLPRLIARFNEERVLAGAFLGGAAAFMLLPFFTSALTLAVIAFAFGLGMGCGQPIVTMQMFTNSAEGRSGEALGLRMTVNHLTRVVGPVLFGVIGSSFGLAAVFWINGLMLGGGSAITRNTSTRSQTDKLGV